MTQSDGQCEAWSGELRHKIADSNALIINGLGAPGGLCGLFGKSVKKTGGSDGARTRDLRRDRPHQIQWNQRGLQHFLRPKPPETRKKLQLENPADALPSSGPTL